MNNRILSDFFGNVKRLLRGEPAPRSKRQPHPMDCVVCGEFGMNPVHREFRTSWYCESCYPPFLRRNGEPITLAGDPGG